MAMQWLNPSIPWMGFRIGIGGEVRESRGLCVERSEQQGECIDSKAK